MHKRIAVSITALITAGLLSCGGDTEPGEGDGPGFLGDDVSALNSQYVELIAPALLTPPISGRKPLGPAWPWLAVKTRIHWA